MDTSPTSASPYKILQVMRAPVGGLFRHVQDLIRALDGQGHHIGLVVASETGGKGAEQLSFKQNHLNDKNSGKIKKLEHLNDRVKSENALDMLEPFCSLGISRIPMPRQLGFSDFSAIRHVAHLIDQHKIDIVHGHGAKGGAYARLGARFASHRPPIFYTPHGGSLHYSRKSPSGLLFLTLEQVLAPLTHTVIFESAYGCDIYKKKVGTGLKHHCIIHNGLRADEFMPMQSSMRDYDLLFVGELRFLKGIDVLLHALVDVRNDKGEPASLLIIGSGPDEQAFKALVKSLGLGKYVQFAGQQPAHEVFSKANVLAMPSRAESLPYIILEAAAAELPMVATNVGGIVEIFGPDSGELIPADNVSALKTALNKSLQNMDETRQKAQKLKQFVQEHFHIDVMVKQIVQQYNSAFTDKHN